MTSGKHIAAGISQAERPGRTGRFFRLFLLVLLWPTMMVLFTACGTSASAKITVTGEALGTFYTITLIAPPDRMDEVAVKRLAEDVLDEVNRLMSTYRDDSELSRFNRHAEATPFPVTEATFTVFQMAQVISEQSGGAFDVTVGPLVNAWGFGSDTFEEPPEDREIASLLERVGYQKITLQPDGSIRKARPDIYCDLSAIAKGYAVDAVAERLESVGISRYMVEVGGEIRVAGLSVTGKAWQLGIEEPVYEGRKLHAIVQMGAGALATSGNYRNMYEVDGKLFAHTIDPHSGYPTRHQVASASVIHESCAMADGYATALMALGKDKALALAQKENLAVMLIVAGEESGIFETVATDGFTRYLQD